MIIIIIVGDIMNLHTTHAEFKFLQDLSVNIHEVVSFFKNHHKLNSSLRQWHKEKRIISLIKPGAIKWGSYYYSM